MRTLENLAIYFAKYQHVNQKRKYTGEPYFNHCKEVATLVKSVTDDIDMICAAYLHDTIEDTGATPAIIYELFGTRVCQLVQQLTDISKPSDGNRTTRKSLDRQHTAKSEPDAQIIKYADLISNTKSIRQYDPDFAKVYMKEKKLLLEVMNHNLPLYKEANQLIEEYYASTS